MISSTPVVGQLTDSLEEMVITGKNRIRRHKGSSLHMHSFEVWLFEFTIYGSVDRSRIHERTILLRFLGIIFRVLRLEVS
jgi:hypothetical protein